MNNDKKSLRKKYAEEGCLNAAFTLDGWFVKIKPAYDIDKVVFSFVKKGTDGKTSFDVYLDMDIFDLWMDDVSTYRMKKVIDTEKANGEKYPKEYKSVTGENGSFTVGVCASEKLAGMYVINGSGKHKEDGKLTGNLLRAFVPVDYNWLRITAKYYKRTCTEHFSELSGIILSESRKQHNPEQGVVLDESYPNSEDNSKSDNRNTNRNVDSNSSTSVNAKNNNQKNTRAAGKPNDTQAQTTPDAKPETAPNKAKPNAEKAVQNSTKTNSTSITYKDKEDISMTIDTSTNILPDGPHWKFQALDSKGNTLNIIITQEIANAMGDKFKLLKDACDATFKNKKHTHLSILCRKGTYNNYNVLFLTGIN